MFTFGSRLSLVVLVLATSAGCSHFFESRAIDKFAANLRNEDLDGLKETTSTEFAGKALRTASALEDFKILRVPDGKTSIVEVEVLSDSRRRVTVQVGDSKKEVFYELVQNDSRQWVVDDVFLKQKKQGVTAFKSVTEQMDLLLTIRDFLDAWDGGDRERVLAVVAPELRSSLDRLPPSYLAELTAKVIGDRTSQSTYKPQAQLEEKLAVVRLPRKAGETVLTLRRKDDQWVVTDIAIDAKDDKEKIPSVHKLAIAINTGTDFLQAYQRADLATLKQVCDGEFYEGSLVVANLKQVLLPAPQLPDHRLEAQLRTHRADLMLRSGTEVVQIDLRREESVEPDALPQFKVREVTIFELESRQEKRLSALFTAQEMLQVFASALAERDLDYLRHSVTQDFAGRVWQRLNAATIQGLPLDMFDDPNPEIVSMTFQGALTRMDVRQSGQPVTYLLREENGRFYVDDVLWQIPGRPASVKQTLDVLVPVRNFAAAITLGRDPAEQTSVLEMLQETCSSDFNRLVWQQAEFVPNSGLSADTFLDTPLTSVTLSENEVLIKLGDDQYGASILLRKQNGRHVVDEIQLIAGAADSDRMEVKKTLRTLLANGRAVPPAPLGSEIRMARRTSAASAVQQAVYQEFDDESPREIWPAGDSVDIGPVESAPRPLP